MSVKYVAGGTLDRSHQINPDVHIFMRSKRDFVQINDGKPQCDVFYDRAQVWREDARQRLETVMPVIQKWRDERAAMSA
jgi:hypothetical protein